jgi:hypothetical protein
MVLIGFNLKLIMQDVDVVIKLYTLPCFFFFYSP